MTRSRAPTTNTEPKLHFRGTSNDPEAHLFLWKRKITSTEFALLSVIDSHVGEEGCWASYSYLGKWVGVKRWQITNMIKKLKGIGLLKDIGHKIVGSQKRRLLMTKWSSFTCVVDHTSEINHTQSSSLLRKDSVYKKIPKGANMGDRTFYPLEEEGKSTQATKEDYEVATKFQEAVAKVGIYSGSSNRKRQAQEYRLLRNTVGEERAKAAVEWYCHYLKKNGRPRKGVPSVTSIRKLRCADGLFNWVEKCMEENPIVVVTKNAKRLTRHVDYWGWSVPKEQIREVVQVSLDNLDKFWKKVSDLNKRSKGRTKRHASRIIDCLVDPSVFVVMWMRNIFDRIKNWKEWDGNLKRDAFRYDHKMFKEIGREWMREYTGEPKDWDRLMVKL